MYSLKKKLHQRQKSHLAGNLRTLAIDITTKCNMSCHYCYAESFVNQPARELESFKVLLDEAYHMGVFHYVLQGGEPILERKRLESIIEMCRPDESYINVVSNGWSFDQRIVKWLKEIQVDKVTFSLDSGLAEEHDQIRGLGSFQRVLKAIDLVLEANLLSGISIVVTHQSLYSKGFKLAYELALEKGIRLHIQIAEPVGKWEGCQEKLMRPEDSKYIDDLYQQSPILMTGQKLVHRDIFCGTQPYCPAGSEFMSISASGHILPCNFLQFSLGQIGETSLEKVRNDLLKKHWFQGQCSQCLCGENKPFIEQFITPYNGQKKPLNAHQIFQLNE